MSAAHQAALDCADALGARCLDEVHVELTRNDIGAGFAKVVVLHAGVTVHARFGPDACVGDGGEAASLLLRKLDAAVRA